MSTLFSRNSSLFTKCAYFFFATQRRLVGNIPRPEFLFELVDRRGSVNRAEYYSPSVRPYIKYCLRKRPSALVDAGRKTSGRVTRKRSEIEIMCYQQNVSGYRIPPSSRTSLIREPRVTVFPSIQRTRFLSDVLNYEFARRYAFLSDRGLNYFDASSHDVIYLQYRRTKARTFHQPRSRGLRLATLRFSRRRSTTCVIDDVITFAI